MFLLLVRLKSLLKVRILFYSLIHDISLVEKNRFGAFRGLSLVCDCQVRWAVVTMLTVVAFLGISAFDIFRAF